MSKEQRTWRDVDIVLVTNTEELRANASAWGITANVGIGSENRYAAYRVVEVQRCSWIDDRTAIREAPPNAVYYPATICFGYKYEAVLEGNASEFTAGVKAELGTYNASVGLETFAARRGLKHRVVAQGLKRADSCGELFVTEAEQVDECFDPHPKAPTPIWVEWRPIPGRKAERKKFDWRKGAVARCGGTSEKCLPCQLWEFNEVTYEPPKAGLEVRLEVTDADGRTRTFHGSHAKLTSDLIFGRPGDVISYQVWDKDVWFDDLLGGNMIDVQEYHRNGLAAEGSLALTGRCTRF